ncbi:hypothetical protein PG985_010409 [Apiospora marii]|uniref:Uncharacterized protein n=1 Tax=Apiospora marii TaxID=335849 RepID=A0ABR1RZD2_9PEZI
MSATEKIDLWSDVAESRAIAEALQHLPDIRDKDIPRQDHLLLRSHPAKYSAGVVREQASENESNEPVDEDMRAIDLSIVLGRYLLAYVHPNFRQYPDPDSPDPELRQVADHEKNCLLVQLMFTNYLEASGEMARQAQSLLRWCAARQMAKSLQVDRVADLGFRTVMESPLMQKAFWGRPPFLFTGPFHYYSQSGDPSFKRVEASGQYRDELSLDSLTKWDGKSELATILQPKVGYLRQGRHEFITFTNHMAVVRVWYTPGPGDPRKTFAQLKTLELPTYRSENRPNGKVGFLIGTEKLVLAAVVHFGRKDGKGDVLRMYGRDGEQIRVDEDLAYLEDDEWRIGDPDEGEYMLYYVPAPIYPFAPTVELVPRTHPAFDVYRLCADADVPLQDGDGDEDYDADLEEEEDVDE